MKKRKSSGQIKINPKVKKAIFNDKGIEKPKFEAEIVYPKDKRPLKAIRNKCLSCCGDSKHEVKHCPVEKCTLWPFRFGKNPFIKREMTDDQRAAAAERLQKAREAKTVGKVRKPFNRKG